MEGAPGAWGEWIGERVLMTVKEFCTGKAVLSDRINSPVIPPLPLLWPYVKTDLSHYVGAIAVDAIRKAGEHFKFRCPLDGEWKVGRNWAETH